MLPGGRAGIQVPHGFLTSHKMSSNTEPCLYGSYLDCWALRIAWSPEQYQNGVYAQAFLRGRNSFHVDSAF